MVCFLVGSFGLVSLVSMDVSEGRESGETSSREKVGRQTVTRAMDRAPNRKELLVR